MKKNLKKLLLFMMAMLLMLSFVACSSDDDDDDDDKDDDKKTEASKDAGKSDDDEDDDKKNNADSDDKKKEEEEDDDDDKKKDDDDEDDNKKDDEEDDKPNKPSNVITNGKAKAEDVAEDFFDAFEDLDIDAMSDLVADDIEMFEEGTMKAFEQFEGGRLTYDEDGVKCEMILDVKSKLGDVEEIDVDDLKDLMEDSKYYDDVDFDEISEVYECSATIDMKMSYDNIKVDPSALDLTEAEVEQFEAEMGMSIEEVMKTYLNEAFESFNDEMDVCIYVADYDGDWKVVFAD